MMIRKLLILVFNITVCMVILACNRNYDNGKKKVEQMSNEKEAWEAGKRLFLDNCSACHIAVEKDSIFFSIKFNSSEDEITKKLMQTLREQRHINFNIDSLSDEQVKQISKYIFIPTDKNTVK